MQLNSLALRLLATAVAWTLLVLPIAGLIISSMHRKDVETGFNERMHQLLTVIIADSIDRTGVEPVAPRDVGEPLFGYTLSGWYWQIRPLESAPGRRMVSPSLVSETLVSPIERKALADKEGIHWLDAKGPADRLLRIAETVFTIGEDQAGPSYAYSVAAPLDWLDEKIHSFRNRLMVALALTGVGLVGVTLFQIRFVLHPLGNIERGLQAIRTGDAMALSGELPTEIEPLQREVNALLKSNQDVIERARTQVGNLAHALKTPLAVITNEARDDKTPFGAKVAAQAVLMRDQINHYLERAQMAARAGTVGRATDIKPVVESLQRALERIYRDKGIQIRVIAADGLRFQGEKQDLEEMLGNLLDNACKWARAGVTLEARLLDATARGTPRRLQIEVSDDGPGLPDEQRAKLGKRGVRLDETKPGSGLGLSIVIDLAQSYRGSFALEAAPSGGLLARLELPAV